MLAICMQEFRRIDSIIQGRNTQKVHYKFVYNSFIYFFRQEMHRVKFIELISNFEMRH